MVRGENDRLFVRVFFLFGKPVVILVVIRQCHIPMPRQVAGESAADVRGSLRPRWEMDIRKALILIVREVVAEEDRMY